MDTVKFSIIIFFVNNDKIFVFEMNKTVSFSVSSNKNQQNESESIFQSPTIQDLRVDHNLEEPISAESLTLLVNEEVAIVQNRLHNISYNLEYAISGDHIRSFDHLCIYCKSSFYRYQIRECLRRLPRHTTTFYLIGCHLRRQQKDFCVDQRIL